MTEKLVEFNEVLVTRLVELSKNKDLRVGQNCYNILQDFDAELAEEICGTDNDPFYNDDNLEKFFQYVIHALGEK